ncbi:MAG TPA: ammonium transporter, partial [Thermodesulfobacteriota bacterium]|nr:ammonium transporter [Thermodesulfobacteriota bacterium]
MTKRFVIITILGVILGGLLLFGIGYAQQITPAPAAPSAAPALKPDPSGANTGGAADVVGATPGAPTADEMKKWATNEPLAMKLADVVGHNRIAINIVWTLLCGFLVFFMQAGFALVETGFTRAKNASHTMAMNLMVFVFGVLGYWVMGYALQMGGVGANPLAGGTGLLDGEFTLHLLGKDFGLLGT